MDINIDRNKRDDLTDSMYGEIDSAILEDPIQLLKWFEAHEERSESTSKCEDSPTKLVKRAPRKSKDTKAINTQASILDDIINIDDNQVQEASAGGNRSYTDWLSQKMDSLAQSELFEAYKEIERLSLKYGFIHSPLLQLCDAKTIRNLQSQLMQKKEFQKMDPTLRYTCGLALRYYTQYLSEQGNTINYLDQNRLPSTTTKFGEKSSGISSSQGINSYQRTLPISLNPISTDGITNARTYADGNNQPLAEMITEDLNAIKDTLTQYLSHISKTGNPTIVEAYQAYLTEKLRKSPEQVISDAVKNLLFVIKSIETYNTLASYAQYLSEQKVSSDCIDITNGADSNLIEASGSLSQQGITPGWLYMHGLNSIVASESSLELVDTSSIRYKKIKKGIRIDTIKTSGRIFIPDFIEGLPVIKIGANAFKRRKDITSVILPKYLLEIEEDAFEQSGITSIIIPDSVEIIGRCAFRDCKKLTSVKLPLMLKTIKWSTFSGCSYLKSIKIPANVATICDSAFSGCTRLKKVQVPDSVTRLESYVFSSKPVLYCNSGSRASRYAEEWYLPKTKAFEDYDADLTDNKGE